MDRCGGPRDLLGTGLALIALGPQAGRRPFLTVLGVAIDTLTLHQAAFIGFAVVTGLHLLARIVPAASLLTGRIAAAVPGRVARLAVLFVVLATAGITAALVLSASSSWQRDPGFGPGRGDGPPGSVAPR